jgi:hypothetical protein
MEYEFFYSVTFFLFFCMSTKKCLYMSASGDSCKWSLTFLKGCTCHEKTKNATLGNKQDVKFDKNLFKV